MKKCIDFKVGKVEQLSPKHVLLRLVAPETLPEIAPGQFVEVRVDNTPSTYLRRPISINNVVPENKELHLLVAAIGDGTRYMASLKEGDTLNVMLPLGNGFTMPESVSKRHLLVGGGVGVAPLLYLGKKIKEMGGEPTFLLGARTAADVLMLNEFEAVGRTLVTTEDASMGEKGFVTQHSVLQKEQFDFISTCGPKPMMKAVAQYAQKSNTPCEVSLENKMACGLGACLCCVEKTNDKGHICVCTEGPVINASRLEW